MGRVPGNDPGLFTWVPHHPRLEGAGRALTLTLWAAVGRRPFDRSPQWREVAHSGPLREGGRETPGFTLPLPLCWGGLLAKHRQGRALMWRLWDSVGAGSESPG